MLASGNDKLIAFDCSSPEEFNMRKPLLPVMRVIATLNVPVAHKDITYQYVTDRTSYIAAAGQSVTVELLLQETLTGGSGSHLLSESGLFGAGVCLPQLGVILPSPTIVAGPIAANLRSPPNGVGTGGNHSQQPATATNAGIVKSVSNSASGGPTGTPVNPNVQLDLRGTLTMTAGGAGSTTQFTSESYKNTSGIKHDTRTFTKCLACASLVRPCQLDSACVPRALESAFCPEPSTRTQPSPSTMSMTKVQAKAMVRANRTWRRLTPVPLRVAPAATGFLRKCR